jgi:hypothetical protein
MADDVAEVAEGGSADDAGSENGANSHSARWWLTAVVVPIVIAMISSTTVLISKRSWSADSPPPRAASSASPPAGTLPPADPVPAAWCFECYPHLVLVARECRDGSMSSCDDLWESVEVPATATEGDPAAIRDYGMSCGGRRQLKASGYRYKDCVDEFPGHN